MTTPLYPNDQTGLLLVDPYNDFLSEGGKLNRLAKPVADAVDTVRHLREIVAAARAFGIRIFDSGARRNGGIFAGGHTRRTRDQRAYLRPLDPHHKRVAGSASEGQIMKRRRCAYRRPPELTTRSLATHQKPDDD